MTQTLLTWNEIFGRIEEENQRFAIQNLHEATVDPRKEMPASINRHHCWPGGWEIHTHEVCDNIIRIYDALILGQPKFTISEAITAAYVHDLDKLLYRYKRSTEQPTQPQIAKARAMGIEIDALETKASISEKIGAAVEGRIIDAAKLPRHVWNPESEPMEDGAIVVWLCQRYRVPLSLKVVHAVCFHHGGYNPYIREMPAIEISPLATLLHMADIASSKIQAETL